MSKKTPTIIPRDQHCISRKQIDPDTLKVLRRLHRHGYKAYLVGGSVRDLLLGRQPKDFDIRRLEPGHSSLSNGESPITSTA